MIPVHIYVLIDPETLQVRYVGLTRDVQRRLSRYCRPHTLHLANWFNSLKAKGTKPVLEVIETVPEFNSGECEKKWISYYRERGCRLLNFTDGGERSYSISDEYREKLSASKRGKKRVMSDSWRHAQSLARRGKPSPIAAQLAERLRQINYSRRGIPLSEETKRKLSEIKKGKRPYVMTDLTRKNMSESAKRRWAAS